MKKIMTTLVLAILFNASVIAQCSCYSVEGLSIVGQDSMELVLSNACDENVYLNLYVISSIAPFDTLGKQEFFGAFILPFNTNVPNILSTNLSTPPMLGTYRVSITNGTLACDSLQFSTALNTTNIRYDNFKSISPNPFNTTTTIAFEKVLKEASLTIYNSNGQEVKQIKGISGQIFTLNRDNLGSGIYFLTLTQDSQLIAMDKLVVKDY